MEKYLILSFLENNILMKIHKKVFKWTLDSLIYLEFIAYSVLRFIDGTIYIKAKPKSIYLYKGILSICLYSLYTYKTKMKFYLYVCSKPH